MPRISIPGGIYLDTAPGAAEYHGGTAYRFLGGPLREFDARHIPVAAHTITIDLPDPRPLPQPEVSDSDFGAFDAAVAELQA